MSQWEVSPAKQHCWSHSCSNGNDWETAQILGVALQLHIGELSVTVKIEGCLMPPDWYIKWAGQSGYDNRD